MVLTHSLSWGCSQDCWLGLWPTKKAQLGLKDPVPRWLTLMAHESVLTDRGGLSQSVSTKMDLSIRLLVCQDTEAGFPRESQEWARWNFSVFYDLASAVPLCHFCKVCLVPRVSGATLVIVGGACTEVWVPGGSDPWGSSWRLATTPLIQSFFFFSQKMKFQVFPLEEFHFSSLEHLTPTRDSQSHKHG